MPLFLHTPDIEAICGVALRAAGFRAYSSIPDNPQYPLITIKRIGGAPVDKRVLDRANIQIDVWGDGKSQCRDLARDSRLVLLSLEGSTSSDFNGVVTAVNDSLGLTWLPDDLTKRDRYIFSLMVYAKQYLPVVT